MLCHSLFGADSALESAPFFGITQSAFIVRCGSFVIAFLDSYEIRFKVRRRTRGADGGRHLRRNKRKYECPGLEARAFNNVGNWSPALLSTYAGCVVSCSNCIPNRPADPGYSENANTSGKPGQCGQAPLDEELCL
ncbi:hypothetical protein CSV91_09545 [Collinsella aerofaciens]|uniref:Uncharacterized protein n=1 Tax=Collinsella aerofaciens TaxID=74426 RepID=A0A2D1TZJ0_9ACTN|nr:hypothetical protein CSV91_09545 [Collinsella aerofaciens]